MSSGEANSNSGSSSSKVHAAWHQDDSRYVEDGMRIKTSDVEIADVTDTEEDPVTNNENGSNADAAAARKRSRFSDGKADEEPSTSTTSSTTANGVGSTATAANGSNAEGSVTAEAPKKRSRWGDAPPEAKKSRWGSAPAVPVANPLAAAFGLGPGALTLEQQEALQLRAKLHMLDMKLAMPVIVSDTPDRSPSPEPIYDKNGVRTNTRAQRMREKIINEQKDIVMQLVKIDLSYKPPVHLKPETKKIKKLFIPLDKHPDYNFFGLIIGPRGNTQKRMEKETGAKISIRGKGSAKGAKNNPKKQNQPDEDEPLHVHVQAETQEALDKAVDIIEKLLVPVDEKMNDHKAKQLRELASINGTLRDEVVCRVCGERGHKIHECPNRTGAAWKPANVLCTICGQATHLTNDCPQKEKSGGDMNKLQTEYLNFMAELTGGAPSSSGLAITSGPSGSSGSAPAPSISVPTAGASSNPILPSPSPPPPTGPLLGSGPAPAPQPSYNPYDTSSQYNNYYAPPPHQSYSPYGPPRPAGPPGIPGMSPPPPGTSPPPPGVPQNYNQPYYPPYGAPAAPPPPPGAYNPYGPPPSQPPYYPPSGYPPAPYGYP